MRNGRWRVGGPIIGQAMRRADLLMWSQNELAISYLKTRRAIADYDWSVRDNRPFI